MVEAGVQIPHLLLPPQRPAPGQDTVLEQAAQRTMIAPMHWFVSRGSVPIEIPLISDVDGPFYLWRWGNGS